MRRIARCCCGGLSAETEGEPDAVVVCHCLDCQRRTGSAFGAVAFFAADAVRISGASGTYKRASDAGRKLTFHFCPRCGTTVHWKTERHPGKIAIAVGAFADPDFAPPSRSVFNRSRHRWLDLPPDIPAHIAGRDSALTEGGRVRGDAADERVVGMRESRDKITATRKPARPGRDARTGDVHAMPDTQPDIAELDARIADVRENLRELVEQAAAYSGAADDELVSQRIADQEALLERLTKQRDQLVQARR